MPMLMRCWLDIALSIPWAANSPARDWPEGAIASLQKTTLRTRLGSEERERGKGKEKGEEPDL